MSLRTFLRAVVVGTALTAAAVAPEGSAQAQAPIPIPSLPPGTPPIPGLPTPGGGSPIPGIPGLPAPGGTPGIPSIPGLPGIPGLKLFSPTGTLLMPFMKDEAKKIFEKEKAALPADRKAKVDGTPLLFDSTKDEVNALAACDDSGKPLVAITEGLMQIVDLMSAARATDEVFSTSYYDAYVKDIAAQQEGKAVVLGLPPGMLDITKSLDSRKLKRQRQIFDEAMALVVGHELAHHYMGHVTCGGSGTAGPLKPGDLVKMATKVVPLLNQPIELQADIEGVKNVLDAGQNEAEYHWSENGGLLVFDFFKKVQELHPGAILFGFMNTHPLPQVRIPVVKNTANLWRLTHPGTVTGTGGPSDPPKLPLPFPMPSGMPGAPVAPSK